MTEQNIKQSGEESNYQNPLPDALKNIVLRNSIKMSSVGALFREYDPNFLNNLIEYMKRAENDGYGQMLEEEFVFHKSI